MDITGDDAPMVSFRKVRKVYGPLVVLDDLDLDVAAGNGVDHRPVRLGKDHRAPDADDA